MSCGQSTPVLRSASVVLWILPALHTLRPLMSIVRLATHTAPLHEPML